MFADAADAVVVVAAVVVDKGVPGAGDATAALGLQLPIRLLAEAAADSHR